MTKSTKLGNVQDGDGQPVVVSKKKKEVTVKPGTSARIMANKQRRTTVQAQAWKALEALLGKSMRVIAKELDDRQQVMLLDGSGAPILDEKGNPKTIWVGGNPKVAMWLADKITGNTGGLLLTEVGGELGTMAEVVSTAQRTLELVLSRELPLEDGIKLIDLLLRYAAMRSFEGVEELRQMMVDLQAKTISGTAGAPTEMRPSWGKLQQMAAVNQARPAE
jgi:hypothetical protein